MNIKKLIKDLDPVTIIEFKNYIIDNLSDLCSKKNSNSKVISKFKEEKCFVKNVEVKYIKMVKRKIEFKSIFAVAVN